MPLTSTTLGNTSDAPLSPVLPGRKTPTEAPHNDYQQAVDAVLGNGVPSEAQDRLLPGANGRHLLPAAQSVRDGQRKAAQAALNGDLSFDVLGDEGWVPFEERED